MEIVPVSFKEKDFYNSFIHENYPPVGAFMQTWEWGIFQEILGRKIGRYFIKDNNKIIGAFTFVEHSLLLGIKYGYFPRGPVVLASYEHKIVEIYKFIRNWAFEKKPYLVFLRLEPPRTFISEKLIGRDFVIPEYYIQPRHNTAVKLDLGDDREVSTLFHSSTRSNLKRAERRGVTIKIKDNIKTEEVKNFFEMIENTNLRNKRNIYPSESYFSNLFSVFLKERLTKEKNKCNLSMSLIWGYCHGEPAAVNLVLFFGDTATYLYGASYGKYLNSKVTTYLHWTAMKEAKQKGFSYYDLGGIDAKRWPTLTEFKRQFNGEEFSYIGNLDIPIKPVVYNSYNFLRKLKRFKK